MPGDAPVQDPFKEVASFLVEIGKLDQTDADIYALGLKKFVITSNDVIHEFPKLRQNTAGGRLQFLARIGFFENTISDKSRKNAAKKFKAVPPSISLKKILSASARLDKSLAMFEEHYENPDYSSASSDEEEIWLSNSDDISISRGAAMIRATNSNLKISSNDCSWMKEQQIEEALKSISSQVQISVVANPDQEIVKRLNKLGARLRKAKDTGIPFCIVDDKTLIMVSQSGAVKTRHTLMTTTQSYMVKKYIGLFNRFVRHSKPVE